MEAIITPTTNAKFVGSDCYDLPVTIHQLENKQCAEACFELTEEELKEIVKNKKIYFSFFGTNLPPMMLHTKSYIKEVQDEKMES